jgi:hypothetical protein
MTTDIIQRSPEWVAARWQKITASRFADAVSFKEKTTKAAVPAAPTKGREAAPREFILVSSDARNTYMRQLVAELLAEVPREPVSSKSMSWGADAEAPAFEAWELETGIDLLPGGFFTHPDYPFIGASPDGLIRADGGLELKSPYDPQVHIRTWDEGMPDDHMPQVQGGIFCAKRSYWEFCSFDPRAKNKFQLYRQRIDRDSAYIKKLETDLLQFWAEVQAMVKRIEEKAHQ